MGYENEYEKCGNVEKNMNSVIRKHELVKSEIIGEAEEKKKNLGKIEIVSLNE